MSVVKRNIKADNDRKGGNMKYKHCWVARETKKGWKLGLAVGNKKTFWIPYVYAKTVKDVERIVKSNIVFVHLRGAK